MTPLRKALIDRAKLLARAGYSSIPVQGDSSATEPKRPTVNWKKYQRLIASESEVESMFSERARALGIVCGRVSKLLVIDFDDLLRYQRFCRHLPQYSETYTVKTRRGFHLYFRTAERVPSHQFDGGDIKGEKSYVIAPPSTIENFRYRCSKNVAEMELIKADVERLLNYFHVQASVHLVAGKRIREASDVNLERLYQRLAPRLGRNNALYRATSVAREGGLARTSVEGKLLAMHGEMPGRPGHKAESVQERIVEGMRTIKSAYRAGGWSRPAKVGVPNSVRERLLQVQRSTVVCRLLDALLLAGWEADAYFTMTEAVRLGHRYGLNRKSVFQALTGEHCSFDGRHIISRRYVEYLDIRGFNSRKRGRPVELVFQVPAITRLLTLLKVPWSPSDRLREEDLRSAKAYRLALHREYVLRLSPRGSLGVLAGRVGVNERTIRRYNRALDVKVSACVGYVSLTREVLRSLPKRSWRVESNATKGFWLEAADGRRMPAWRHIGGRLLRQAGKGGRVCVWMSSVFCVGPEERPAPVFERIAVAELARLIQARGQRSGAVGMLDRLGGVIEAARDRARAMRYEKIQLFFGNVGMRVADDKVAETINGYLFAQDDVGSEVRRPAKRGIAYRMLKEFGDGNVYLALRSSYKEVMQSLARHALRAGDATQSLELLPRSTA